MMNKDANAMPYCGNKPKAVTPIKLSVKAINIDFFSPIRSIIIPDGIDIIP
ncbi:hypothetical protein D3C80_1761730 [compost metagenome]